MIIIAPPKKGNNFIIEGDTVKIELKRRNENSVYALIDIDDYERVKNFKYTWHSFLAKNTGTYYCAATTYFKDENGQTKSKPLYLQVFIANPNQDPNIYVDHINYDTLDNRKQNLRTTSNSNNLKYRNGKNSNNKSGYRNVCMIQGWWTVQMQINGKNTILAKFKNLDDAGVYAEKMRNKYFGEFAGQG